MNEEQLRDAIYPAYIVVEERTLPMLIEAVSRMITHFDYVCVGGVSPTHEHQKGYVQAMIKRECK